jgi:hypothetical protein
MPARVGLGVSVVSRAAFGGLLAAVIVTFFSLGLWLSRPVLTPLKPTLHTSFESMKAEANAPQPVPDADTAPGWQDRKVLRDHLSDALGAVEASPCDPATRTAFFKAFGDRAEAMIKALADSPDEKGPAFWRTADDLPLDQRLNRLTTAGYITMDEITRYIMARPMGPGSVVQPTGQGPMDPDKCGNLPTAGSH